jgi:hypothetical protein
MTGLKYINYFSGERIALCLSVWAYPPKSEIIRKNSAQAREHGNSVVSFATEVVLLEK